jgi:hypothetical protein
MRRLVFNTGGPHGTATFVCAATASACGRALAQRVRCNSVPVGCRHRPARPPTRGPAAVRSAISGPAVWAEFRGRGRDSRNSRDCRCFSKNTINGSLWLTLAHVFGTCPMSHDGPWAEAGRPSTRLGGRERQADKGFETFETLWNVFRENRRPRAERGALDNVTLCHLSRR